MWAGGGEAKGCFKDRIGYFVDPGKTDTKAIFAANSVFLF